MHGNFLGMYLSTHTLTVAEVFCRNLDIDSDVLFLSTSCLHRKETSCFQKEDVWEKKYMSSERRRKGSK